VAISGQDSTALTDAAPGTAAESVPPGEADAIATIARVIEDQVRAAAKDGPARQDAHAKAHGCVAG
jgi:hypothetical protein